MRLGKKESAPGTKSPALEMDGLKACRGEKPWGGAVRSSLKMGTGVVKAA